MRAQSADKFGSGRNGIEAAGMEGCAFHQPFERQPCTSSSAMHLNGLDRVVGTGRSESAAARRAENHRKHGRQGSLIHLDQQNQGARWKLKQGGDVHSLTSFQPG